MSIRVLGVRVVLTRYLQMLLEREGCSPQAQAPPWEHLPVLGLQKALAGCRLPPDQLQWELLVLGKEVVPNYRQLVGIIILELDTANRRAPDLLDRAARCNLLHCADRRYTSASNLAV